MYVFVAGVLCGGVFCCVLFFKCSWRAVSCKHRCSGAPLGVNIERLPQFCAAAHVYTALIPSEGGVWPVGAWFYCS